MVVWYTLALWGALGGLSSALFGYLSTFLQDNSQKNGKERWSLDPFHVKRFLATIGVGVIAGGMAGIGLDSSMMAFMAGFSSDKLTKLFMR